MNEVGSYPTDNHFFNKGPFKCDVSYVFLSYLSQQLYRSRTYLPVRASLA